MKKHFLFVAILIASLLMLTRLAIADSFFVPRATHGIMNYKYKQEFGEVSLDASFVQSLGAGATLFYSNTGFFVDGYTQKTYNGESENKYTGRDITFDFNELNISAGYKFTESMSLFAGYLERRINFDFEIPSVGKAVAAISHEAHGPFIEATYTLPLRVGVFSVNVGYASLAIDNNNIFTFNNKELPIANFSGSSVFGASDAITVGIGWSIPLTKNLSYSLFLNSYKYATDQFEEKALGFGATFRYQFGFGGSKSNTSNKVPQWSSKTYMKGW
ncbi:hypothetical protein [Candidatus Parabeggiatoa sp. HSG14]|uniref:hypothetical protein n=1 Tax=Candidatus Parabeggiatoa sp. HSG14 TaxID=3055593 RepID=UPI0025A6A0F5|nr:hypothetical protein [Thiotrichales bacterium HSG14]